MVEAMKQTWKVALHEAAPQSTVLAGGAPAKALEQFSVQASNVDEAKKSAKAWLEGRGYALRSVNVVATQPRQLVAYVKPKG